jgi:predicted SprT family Zn-dependent metalloprotease
MLYSWYESDSFKTKPLSNTIQKEISDRQKQVLSLIDKKYKLQIEIPLVVSDEFSSRLYGLTSYKDGRITVYLNKKRFKESKDYMIEEVIPHEYAHALVMALGERSSQDGHTQLWQDICLELDGKICTRYVDNEEIIAQKMKF